MSVELPKGYQAQTITSLALYLNKKLPANLELGGDPSSWKIQEVGDGNLNLVFIVEGSKKAIIVKQALPFVRAAGEGWPLSLTRAFFECNVLKFERKYAGGKLVPEIYFYDPSMALFAMEFLETHIILRKELIAGKKFKNLAEDLGHFLATTLFHSSDLGMEAADKKQLVSEFAKNDELCKITEDLIFTEPYFDAPRNNWTSPQLDEQVFAIWKDTEMIQVAMKYKYKFMTQAQSLLHGDLHSGSIMVTDSDTKVIDPEFGFMGPMAFDIGNFIGNMFFSFFSQDAHIKDPTCQSDYKEWILEQIETTWAVFEKEFRTLWTNKTKGDAYPNEIYANNPQLLIDTQDDFMNTLFIDSLINAGLEMNRRIIGFAGVADFKEIIDPDLRAQCESKALKLARVLITQANTITTFANLKELATKI